MHSLLRKVAEIMEGQFQVGDPAAAAGNAQWGALVHALCGGIAGLRARQPTYQAQRRPD
jgi:hypothetical protein